MLLSCGFGAAVLDPISMIVFPMTVRVEASRATVQTSLADLDRAEPFGEQRRPPTGGRRSHVEQIGAKFPATLVVPRTIVLTRRLGRVVHASPDFRAPSEA